jgi:hypothetical protein
VHRLVQVGGAAAAARGERDGLQASHP